MKIPMITYELAKKLKEAGFPQRVSMGTLVWSNGFEAWRLAKDVGGIGLATVLVCPTLEELIEACGKEIRIYIGKKGVSAAQHGIDFKLRGYGLTPKIAVANLWLALNER